MKLDQQKILGDQRGYLVALEEKRSIPFEIKRVFYIFGTLPGVPRGNHSHYKTKQYLIAVNGACKVTLFDLKILWMTFLKVVKRSGVSH